MIYEEWEQEAERRTPAQNRAEHLWFRQIAQKLNDAGYSVNDKVAIRVDIPFSEYAIKEYMFKSIAKAMFDKDSTTKLTKQQTSEVIEVLTQALGERFGIHVPFPEDRGLGG